MTVHGVARTYRVAFTYSIDLQAREVLLHGSDGPTRIAAISEDNIVLSQGNEWRTEVNRLNGSYTYFFGNDRNNNIIRLGRCTVAEFTPFQLRQF